MVWIIGFLLGIFDLVFSKYSPNVCSLNYELIGDQTCIRIFTLPQSWQQAEDRCKQEGSHLISIRNSLIQSALRDYIRLKISSSDPAFLPPVDVENFWTGGTVRETNDWRWIATLHNFSSFSYWKDRKVGSGCTSNKICLENSALKLTGKVGIVTLVSCDVILTNFEGESYVWMAEEKQKVLPYICESTCHLGYQWQNNFQKCVKIERNLLKSHSEASFFCGKEGSKLVSVESCPQLKNLIIDLKSSWNSALEKYWIGFYAGVEEYDTRPHFNFVTCQDLKFLDQAGGQFNPTNGHEYFGLLEYSSDSSIGDGIKLFKKTDLEDGSSQEMFICEVEEEWECSDGYTRQGQHCYKLLEEKFSSGEAELKCKENYGDVLLLESLINLHFLTNWLNEKEFTPETVYLGYMRHTTTLSNLEHLVYTSFDGHKIFENNRFKLAIDSNIKGDCLILKKVQDYFVIVQSDCNVHHNIICMKHQHSNTDQKWQLENSVQLILPMDRETKLNPLGLDKAESFENNVALSDTPPPSGLEGSASFLRKLSSFIELSKKVTIKTANGITILVWVFLTTAPLDNEKMFILDESKDENEKSLEFYIHKVNSKTLLGTQLCSEQQVGLVCSVFSSHNSMNLEMNVWNFVGFTYSTDDKRGTFIVNNTFGTSDREGSYFSYDALNWLSVNSITGPLVGMDKKFSNGLDGKMSCLQIYEYSIRPSQSMELQTCPVTDDRRSRPCPERYFKHKNNCFMVSETSADFSNAEYQCSSVSNDGR